MLEPYGSLDDDFGGMHFFPIYQSPDSSLIICPPVLQRAEGSNGFTYFKDR